MKVTMDSLTGVPSPDFNLELFRRTISKKIFQKFGLNENYNTLTNKWFYDLNITMDKCKLGIQGQQTLHWLLDFFPHWNRLVSMLDISKSCDPEKEKLPYLIGLGKWRHKNHG